MAKENVRKFYEKLVENKELQEKLEKAQNSYTGDKDDKEAVLEAVLLPIAKEAGYDFTAEELKAAEREMAEEKGISEEELENVSGGVTVGCFVIGAGCEAMACFINGLGADHTAVGIAICYMVGVGIGSED